MGEYNILQLKTIGEAAEMLEKLEEIPPMGTEYNETADAIREHFDQDDGYKRSIFVVEEDGALLLWATAVETEEYVAIVNMGVNRPQAFTFFLDYLESEFPQKKLEIPCPEMEESAISELQARKFAVTTPYHRDPPIYLREPHSLAPWKQEKLEFSPERHRELSLLLRLEFATGVPWKKDEVVGEAGDDILSATADAFSLAPEAHKYVLFADIAPLSEEKETELRKGLEGKFGFTGSSYECDEGEAQIIIPVDDEAVKRVLQVEITKGECAKHFSAPKRTPRLHHRRLGMGDAAQVLSLTCITQEREFSNRDVIINEALFMTQFPDRDYNELVSPFTLVMHDEADNIALCAKCEKVYNMLKLNDISVADADDFAEPLRQLFAVLQSEFEGHTLRFKLHPEFVEVVEESFPEMKFSVAGYTIPAAPRGQGEGRV